MGFITPCFIRKNTAELRKKLEELGYKLNNGKWMGKYLATFRIKETKEWRYVASPEWDLQNNPDIDISIDCGTNENLFSAIAALRDDTDENQWFIMDVEIYVDIPKGTWFQSTDRNGGRHVGTQIEALYCHKATVDELIEHFKNKRGIMKTKNKKKTDTNYFKLYIARDEGK